MAKTLFDNGDAGMGILGTRVMAEWLSKVFAHRHDGKDEDGSAPLDYAPDTGAVNALTLAMAPALTAHVTGLPLHFKAAHTNTGAVTLAVNGMPAVAITLADGSPLNIGNIRKDGIYSVIYTGTAYMLLNPSERPGLIRWEYVLPSGHLKMNGALVSRATYADLYAFAVAGGLLVPEATWTAGSSGLFGDGDGATTFRLPDLRGEFIRGLDEGRLADPGRTLGTRQSDAFRSHVHSSPGVNELGDGDVFERGPGPSTGNVNTGSAGGTETRPRNIALIPCIKY